MMKVYSLLARPAGARVRLSAIKARFLMFVFCQFLHVGFGTPHRQEKTLYWTHNMCSLIYILSAHSVFCECLLLVNIWQPILETHL